MEILSQFQYFSWFFIKNREKEIVDYRILITFYFHPRRWRVMFPNDSSSRIRVDCVWTPRLNSCSPPICQIFRTILYESYNFYAFYDTYVKPHTTWLTQVCHCQCYVTKLILTTVPHLRHFINYMNKWVQSTVILMCMWLRTVFVCEQANVRRGVTMGAQPPLLRPVSKPREAGSGINLNSVKLVWDGLEVVSLGS